MQGCWNELPKILPEWNKASELYTCLGTSNWLKILQFGLLGNIPFVEKIWPRN